MNTLMYLYAQIRDYGRYPDDANIGLPNGSEVGIGLLIAVIAIPIGWLICKASSGKEGNFVGCLGTLLVLGGIVALLPLLAWVCAVGSALYVVGIAIVVVVVIIALIFGSKK